MDEPRQVYLDYNATTPTAPAVLEAMLPFLGQRFGNPSSSHTLGQAGREAVENARGQVAALLKVDSAEIVFTSGGTESNNLALKGVALRRPPEARGHIIVSAIEHPAVLQPARFLQWLGYRLTIVGVQASGVIDPGEVAAALQPDTVLVSVIHANNEIGTIQPIAEIGRICRARGVLVHTDAAQSVGKIRVCPRELEVDLLTVAGHKLYAPKGVGALYLRRGVEVEPLLHGAAHERGVRAGTENVAGIVGLGRAAELAAEDLPAESQRMEQLRDRLLSSLNAAMGQELPVNGSTAQRLPNTLSINFPDVSGHELLASVPEICASTGAACHAGESCRSATLAAIGITEEAARGTVRLSLGRCTDEGQIERAVKLISTAWRRLRK